MSVDEQLRERFARAAESFEPDVERALGRIQSIRPMIRRARSWPVLIAAVAAVVLLVAAGVYVVRRPEVAGVVGEWTKLSAAPLSARYDAYGGWVADRYVVIGGWTGDACPPNADCAAPKDPAERDGASYDPARRRWQTIAEAPVPISVGYSAVIGDSIYLLTGIDSRRDMPITFLRYDADADRWSTLPTPPGGLTQLVAAGQRIISIGGSDEQDPAVDAVFDPAKWTWQPLPADPLGPSFSREAVWLGDRLLLGAHDLVANPGSEKPSVLRLALLDSDLHTWTTLPDSELIGGNLTVVDKLVVVPVTGGADGGQVNNWGRTYPYGGILDPATQIWRALPPPAASGGLICCRTLVTDRLITVDGQLLDPASGAWTNVPPLPGPIGRPRPAPPIRPVARSWSGVVRRRARISPTGISCDCAEPHWPSRRLRNCTYIRRADALRR